ncbi:hypothetical protein K0V07_07135 [Ruficoccus sp. ZRK36]|nr:hypothetical protein K0V07_07135 [Ruficoccus sp. ZRK36]
MSKTSPLSLTELEALQLERAKASLTAQEKLAQLLHPIFWAHWRTETTEGVLGRVGKMPWGGGFLGTADVCDQGPLLREAQQRQKIPMLVSGDHECGCRATRAPQCGRPMNFGAIEPIEEAEELLYRASVNVAQQARALGCHWNFAPVVDISMNWDSPIVNHRAYGDNVERICSLSQTYIRAFQENGMAATAKHFPGDGVDTRDQHIIVTHNTLPFDQWQATYGRTFGAAIDAGVMSIMTGWIALEGRSQCDPRTGLLLPATMDRAIQIDLLREQMGFEGVIITDAFGMGGLDSVYTNEDDLVIGALQGGADMLLFISSSVDSTVEVIEQALNDGRLDETQINASVDRILSMKAKLGLLSDKPSLPDEAAFDQFVNEPAAIELPHEVAERSLTLVRDWKNRYPLKAPTGSKILLIDLPADEPKPFDLNVGEDRDNTQPIYLLASELESDGYEVTCVNGTDVVPGDTSAYEAVIYLTQACPRAKGGTIRLSADCHGRINWPAIKNGQAAYFVSFGNPYAIREIGIIDNYVCAYSRQPNMVEAYAKALLGKIPFMGTCPVDLMLR